MQDYQLMKGLGVPYRAGGLEDQPARKVRLFQVIASQVSENEMRIARNE